MHLNYGEFLRKIRTYCIDRGITNETLVNEPLEDFFDVAKIIRQKGKNKGEPFHFEYYESSRIINNKAEIPSQIREALRREGITEIIEESVQRFYDDFIDKTTTGDMIDEYSTWLENSNSLKKREISQIKAQSNDPGLFLAKIVVRSLKESNLIQSESDALVWHRGAAYIKIIKGDLFTYAMGHRNKKQRIVVIPVNTSFETHVTTKAEKEPHPLVSKNTLHGELLHRLSIKGIKEEQIRCRIRDDLKANKLITGKEKSLDLPIGTIATIEENHAILYLTALSKFDKKNNAHSTKRDVKTAIQKVLDHYDSKGQGYELFLPLIGTGLSRAGLEYQDSLDLIIQTLLEHKEKIQGGINIVVMPDVLDQLTLKKEGVL